MNLASKSIPQMNTGYGSLNIYCIPHICRRKEVMRSIYDSLLTITQKEPYAISEISGVLYVMPKILPRTEMWEVKRSLEQRLVV